MGVSPFTLSPLDRYQPSGYSITPDPIFLKTVSLSSPRLCHSIFVPPSAWLSAAGSKLTLFFYCLEGLTVDLLLWSRNTTCTQSSPTSSNIARCRLCAYVVFVVPAAHADVNANLQPLTFRCASSNKWLTVIELLGGQWTDKAPQSCMSKQPGVVAHPIIKRADCLRK